MLPHLKINKSDPLDHVKKIRGNVASKSNNVIFS